MDDLYIFYKFIALKNNIYCINYRNNNVFSKNHFIKSYKELVSFVEQYKNKDCYMTYNPLKTDSNRKNDNVLGLNMVALDIEYLNKQKPETEIRLKLLKFYIRKFLSKFKINKYLLILSGNGYHLYIPVGNIIKKDIDILKINYKKFIDFLNNILYEISEYKVKLDDRKDLAGILRIPTTLNTSANRIVKIEEVKNGENTKFRKLLLKYLRKKNESNKNLLTNVKLYKLNIDLYEHPLVKMWLEPDLPDNTGKHNTLGFALQSLIFNLNLQNTTEAYNLQNIINTLHNTSLQLNYLTTYIDNLEILLITKKYAKQYYPKYLKEINKLIDKINK